LFDTSNSHDLCIYRHQDIALLHRYRKIFPKQTRSQSLLDLYLFRKNWIIQNPKSEHPIFCNFSFGLQSSLFWLFDIFPPFACLKTLLNSRFLRVISFEFALKLPKPEYPEPGTGLSGFFSRVKFGHQHVQMRITPSIFKLLLLGQ
jgi:hypothetical protein